MSYIVALNYDTDTRMPTIICDSEQKLNKCFKRISHPCGHNMYEDSEGNAYTIFAVWPDDELEQAQTQTQMLRDLYKSVA
jgi:hypothetical protein